MKILKAISIFLFISFLAIGCGSGGGSGGDEVSCKGVCTGQPESAKDHYGTYTAELSGDWIGTSTLTMAETPYFEDFEVYGVSGGATNWRGWLDRDENAKSQTIEDNNYVIYFEFMLPTYINCEFVGTRCINGTYIGDYLQKIWLYFDMVELENGIIKATYKQVNEVNGENTGEATIVKSNGTSYPDADKDGYNSDLDCDDNNANVKPGVAETCGDGIDQDCNGSDLTCSVDPPVVVTVNAYDDLIMEFSNCSSNSQSSSFNNAQYNTISQVVSFDWSVTLNDGNCSGQTFSVFVHDIEYDSFGDVMSLKYDYNGITYDVLIP